MIYMAQVNLFDQNLPLEAPGGVGIKMDGDFDIFGMPWIQHAKSAKIFAQLDVYPKL